MKKKRIAAIALSMAVAAGVAVRQLTVTKFITPQFCVGWYTDLLPAQYLILFRVQLLRFLNLLRIHRKLILFSTDF